MTAQEIYDFIAEHAVQFKWDVKDTGEDDDEGAWLHAISSASGGHWFGVPIEANTKDDRATAMLNVLTKMKEALEARGEFVHPPRSEAADFDPEHEL